MSIVQRMYPEPPQADLMRQWCGQARFVWNRALHLVKIGAIRLGETDRMLTILRQQGDWLGEGPSVVHQAALRDLRQAYANRGKNPEHFGLPTPRKRGLHDGFKIRDLRVRRISRKWAEVSVPKTGWVRFRLTRPFAEVSSASGARVKVSRSGRWTVSFTCDPGEFERRTTGRSVGIDLGCRNTIATQDGALSSIPALTPGEQRRYLALQRVYDRLHYAGSRGCFDDLGRHMTGGCLWRERSKRSIRVRAKMGRLMERLRDRRKDWIEQTTTQLVRDHDLIVLEDLRIPNMVRRPAPKLGEDGEFIENGARAKAALAKAMHASCLGMIRQRTIDKAQRATAPCDVVLVNPSLTSQTCRKCGYASPENRESQAVFRCIRCGHENHADTNAAGNILDRGVAHIESAGRAGMAQRMTRRATTRTRVYQPDEVAA